MDISIFRDKVKKYTEQAINALEEVKKINDIEEQYSKINFNVGIHKRNLNELKENKPKDYYDHYYPYNLGKYEKEVKKLEELEKELLQKSTQLKKIEKSFCNKCKKKITTDNCYVYLGEEEKVKKWAIDEFSKFSFVDWEWYNPLFCSVNCFKNSHHNLKPKNNNKNDTPKKQTSKENNICWECHKTQSDKWFINKETGLEFCSQACNLEHNAELCENCVQKCLKYENGVVVDYQTYYRDSEKKVGILCFSCKQKQRKELEEELEKLQQEQGADEEEMERLRKLIDDSNDDRVNSDKESNNNPERERERERERDNNLTQQSQLRTQISTLESNSNKTAEQEAELEEKRRKLLELEEELKKLNKKNNSTTESKPKSDKTPWIVGGVIVIIIILGIFFLKRTRKRPVRA